MWNFMVCKKEEGQRLQEEDFLIKGDTILDDPRIFCHCYHRSHHD